MIEIITAYKDSNGVIHATLGEAEKAERRIKLLDSIGVIPGEFYFKGMHQDDLKIKLADNAGKLWELIK